MNEDDEDHDGLWSGSAWFEVLCIACATLVTLILGLALWDLLR